jgi:hypothetical protein
MSATIILIAVALALAGVALLQSRTPEPDEIVQPRREPLRMGVQILCGNCAGIGLKPIKTYLDQHGHCYKCGSNSYILVSTLINNRSSISKGVADPVRKNLDIPRTTALGARWPAVHRSRRRAV